MSHRYAPDTLEPARANDWTTRAACKGAASRLFFSRSPRTIAQAVGICTGCPVREECLTDQMAFESGTSRMSRIGVFGGKTPAERWELDPATSKHAPPAVVNEEDEDPPHGDRRRYVARCRCDLCREAESEYRARIADRNAKLKAEAEAAAGAASVPLEPKPSRVLAPCGTPSAYTRHCRNNEPIDAACRAANTAAYERYRATGTTKVLV